MTTKLTKAQFAALAKLADGESTSYRMRVTLKTLWALEARGLVRPRGGLGSMAFPQSMTWFITEAGRTTLSTATREQP